MKSPIRSSGKPPYYSLYPIIIPSHPTWSPSNLSVMEVSEKIWLSIHPFFHRIFPEKKGHPAIQLHSLHILGSSHLVGWFTLVFSVDEPYSFWKKKPGGTNLLTNDPWDLVAVARWLKRYVAGVPMPTFSNSSTVWMISSPVGLKPQFRWKPWKMPDDLCGISREWMGMGW